jgi:rhamnose utilization protein RhaD (predicted bifunctional aldolase and dehydrogenase)
VGETHEESYARTIEAINRAAEFVASRAAKPFGGRVVEPPSQERREVLLDLDEEGAREVADGLPQPSITARADVTDDLAAMLEYGESSRC